MRITRWVPVALFIAAIVVANIITAGTTPAKIGPFLVPWGTWIIGFTFILRDLVQVNFGRMAAYLAIAAALVASAISSAALGDTLAIVVASAIAFAVSETLDAEVFTRLRARFGVRVAASGIVGASFDSVIFVLIGLSPLWSGIVPWSAVPNLILGQLLIKGVLQALAGVAIDVSPWRPAEARA